MLKIFMTLLLLIQIESKQEQILLPQTGSRYSNYYHFWSRIELEIGDLTTFENAGSFTAGQPDYVAADFDDVLFEVRTVPSSTTFTILMPTAGIYGFWCN
jgi:hypothetical protein